jgi:hypothetical protein
MGTFGKSFSREIGKNTGKWASNKLFGDKWSTPYRATIQVQRQERRELRDSAREYKHYLLEERREERNQLKLLKQQEKEDEQLEKQLVIERNLKEVEEHNNYLKVIQTVHLDYAEPIDWKNLMIQPPPNEVVQAEYLEHYYKEYTDKQVDQKITEAKKSIKLSLARYFLSKFYVPKHSWFFKAVQHGITKYIFGLIFIVVLIKLNSFPAGIVIIGIALLLIYQLIKAGSRDFTKGVELSEIIQNLEKNRTVWFEDYMNEHNEAYLKYLQDIKDHKEMVDIAREINNDNVKAYSYAINFFKPFEDLKHYGSDVSVTVNGNLIEVDLYVCSEDVIPNTTKRVLKKGLEIVQDELPRSRFNEIYQDYVCSCILRIGKEIFALLPVDKVLVNAKAMILNTSKGRNEEKNILSVLVEKQILNTLNFNRLDPSDSISNFKHNMNFKKTDGFAPVDVLV